MHRVVQFSVVSAVLGLWSPAAAAAESEFAGINSVEELDKLEPERSLEAELGGAYANGNIWLYSLNAGLDYGHRWRRNELSGVASATLGRAAVDADENGRIDADERPESLTELPENARRIDAELRYDRYLSPRGSVYVLGAAFNDIYSGYTLRSHEQLGYSYRLMDTKQTKLRLELGADVAQELYTPETDPRYANIYAARLLVGLEHAFNDAVSVSDRTEIYENILDPADVRVLNSVSLSSSLTDSFAVKVTHKLIFDNRPVDGFLKSDQTVLVTLVASLL